MEVGLRTPLLDFFRRGEVDRDIRLLAAQGALAPRAIEQLGLLMLLVGDHDSEVARAAEATIAAIPRDTLESFLARSDVPAEVRSFFADRGIESAGTAAPAEETEQPMVDTSSDLIELPDLIDLPDLPELPAVPELAGLENLPPLPDGSLPEGSVPPVPEPLPPIADLPDLPSLDALPPEEAAGEVKASTVQKLARLGIAQRMSVAMKGTREERAILIRDPNKIVAVAVLASPKITETEVEAIAKMTGVSDEILRMIGHTRAWVKSYNIVHSLVKNPKTPVALSMNLLNRLNDKDLRMLSANRNVPEIVRLTARKKIVIDK
jgi:hypothetical protein